MRNIQFVTEYNSNHKKLQKWYYSLNTSIKPAIENEI